MGILTSLADSIMDIKAKQYYTSAVILASGDSSRFTSVVNGAKQLALINDIPLFVYSVLAFDSCREIDEIVLVTKKGYISEMRETVEKYKTDKLIRIVEGGSTRQKSAKLGFDAINPKSDFVAIHDSARCLITSATINKVIKAAYKYGAAACAQKITDTIKRTDSNGFIRETISRDNAWCAQTPQVFMADMYRAASYTAENDGYTATDDCALCERLGFSIKLVESDDENFKVTYYSDLERAKRVIESRVL